MATTIPPVTGNSTIASALFVSMQLGDTTYYISNAYKPITVASNSYTDLGSLLTVSDFTYDYKSTQSTIQFAISGIPNTTDYMNIVQTNKIRGGDIEIRRVFFDTTTLEPLSGQEYLRFKGIISNFAIEENTDFFQGVATNTISFECTSVYTILSKKISGQRTNGSDRRRFYTDDQSFDQVKFNKTLPEFDRQ